MEQTSAAYQSLSDLRDQVGLTLQFMQDTLARVEAAGDNRAAIQSILDEVIRDPKSQTKDGQVLLNFVQGKLASLEPTAPPVARPRDVAATADALTDRIEQAAAPPVSERPAEPASAGAEHASRGLALVEAYPQRTRQPARVRRIHGRRRGGGHRACGRRRAEHRRCGGLVRRGSRPRRRRVVWSQ